MENNLCTEDRNAISRIKQGDVSALETLVKRYQVQAVHAAYAIVYDRALAEDIAQAAFIKALERIHQFDEERPFAPWFFRIVVNDSIKAAKKQKAEGNSSEHSEGNPQSVSRATRGNRDALLSRNERSGHGHKNGAPLEHSQMVVERSTQTTEKPDRFNVR